MKKEINPKLYKMKSSIVPVLMIVMTFSTFHVIALKRIEQWNVFETSFISDREYSNPFLDAEVDVLFISDKQQWVVPAFWAGG